jgi:hypothetical protein
LTDPVCGSALRNAAAAGSANALMFGGSTFSLFEYEELIKKVQISFAPAISS